MKRYAVLLRAVNAGPNNRLPMSDLRQVLLDLGHSEVKTYLQSGNAVIATERADEEAMAAEISAALKSTCGLSVSCLVRSHSELRRVLDANPIAAGLTDPRRFMVTYLAGEPDPARLSTLDPSSVAPEEFAVGSREIYIWVPEAVAWTLNNNFWEKRLGIMGTTRNWNTAVKMAELTA